MEGIKKNYLNSNFNKKRKINQNLIDDSRKHLKDLSKVKDIKTKKQVGEKISYTEGEFLRKQESIVAKRNKKREFKRIFLKDQKSVISERVKEGEMENNLSRRDFIKLGAASILGLLGGKQLLKILEEEKERNYQQESKELPKKRIEEKVEDQEQLEIRKDDEKIIGKTIEDQLKTSDQIVLNLETKNALWKKWKDSYSPKPENYSEESSELGKNYPGLEQAMNRMQLWMNEILEEFKKVGVPEKFAYLAIPESHFKLKDYSRAQARGPYQFTVGTAKLFNLKVNSLVDERCDPIKSAKAAAEHLKDGYERFNHDWDLAFADYNGGFTNRYARYRKNKSDRNYEDFLQWRENGINDFIRRKKENIYRVKKGDTLFGISKIHKVSVDEIKQSNNLKSDDIDVGQKIKINKKGNFDVRNLRDSLENLNYPEKFYAILDVIKEQKLEEKFPATEKSPFDYMETPKGNNFEKSYIVKKGDGLFSIARDFKAEMKKVDNDNRVSIGDVLNLVRVQNKIKDIKKIYPGQEIKFKIELSGNASLITVAEKYGYDLKEILALNPAIKNSNAPLLAKYKVRVFKKNDL